MIAVGSSNCTAEAVIAKPQKLFVLWGWQREMKLLTLLRRSISSFHFSLSLSLYFNAGVWERAFGTECKYPGMIRNSCVRKRNSSKRLCFQAVWFEFLPFLIYIFKLSSYHLAVSFWEHFFLWFNYVLREKSGWVKPINSSDLFITLNGRLEGTFTNSKHVLWVFYIVPLTTCTAIDMSAYVSLRCDIWYLQVHISYSDKGYKLEF